MALLVGTQYVALEATPHKALGVAYVRCYIFATQADRGVGTLEANRIRLETNQPRKCQLVILSVLAADYQAYFSPAALNDANAAASAAVEDGQAVQWANPESQAYAWICTQTIPGVDWSKAVNV